MTIEGVRGGPVEPSKSLPASNATTPSLTAIQNQEAKIKGTGLLAKGVDCLEQLNIKLEEKMPNNLLQRELDKFGEKIENLLSKAQPFVRWIEHNDYQNWYTQLALFLIKLPIRSIKNILTMTYGLIKSVVYSFAHPLKALNHGAQFLIRFIMMLSKPEFYTKMGAGILGATLGNAAVFGALGVPGLVGVGIGGALLFGGIVSGAIKTAIQAEDKKSELKLYFWELLKVVPESFLTGFIMGAIIGAIQKATAEVPAPVKQISGPADAETMKQWMMREYIVKHHLPPPDKVSVWVPADPTQTATTVTFTWNKETLANLQLKYADFLGPKKAMYDLYSTPNFTHLDVTASNFRFTTRDFMGPLTEDLRVQSTIIDTRPGVSIFPSYNETHMTTEIVPKSALAIPEPIQKGVEQALIVEGVAKNTAAAIPTLYSYTR
jgi:hypothetical protein